MAETSLKKASQPNDDAELPFDKMILAAIERRESESEKGEKRRLPLMITLQHRYMNDYASFWDRGLNDWVNVPSAGLMTWPIIGRVVWANTANSLATRIGLECEVTSSDPFLKSAEPVCNELYRYLTNTLWDDTAESLMSLHSQLGCNWFGYSQTEHCDEYATVVQTGKEMSDAPAPDYYCANCGKSGPAVDMATEEGQDLEGAVKCPHCGEERAYLEEAKEGPKEYETITGYDKQKKLKNTFSVISPFLIRADELNSKAGDFSKAHYFFYYSLHRRYELRSLYGDLAEQMKQGDGKTWTNGVKWWHALETNTAPLTAQQQTDSQAQPNRDDDLLQTGRHWFVPGVFANWRSPSDYELIVKGKTVFKIEKDQTVAEAWKAMGKEYRGMLVIASGKQILWVEPERFSDLWVSGLWLMDGASAWGKPQKELLDLQEAMNEWFTMFFEYGLRNSMPHRIIDGMLLDHNDLKNKAGGVSYTKKGYNRQKPISNYVHTLEPGRLSGDLFMIWQLLQQGVDEISGVSKASVGQGDQRNQTLGGQALLTQRSMGLLIPSQKSKKEAKRRFLRQQLKLVQWGWDDDQIKRVLSKDDKAWDELSVQAFRQLDLETDLEINAIEGSDIPITYFERQQRMLQVVMSGILWNPQVPVQIRQQMARFAQIDFDPDEVEAQRRHQSEVLRKIRSACTYAEENGIGYLYTEETGVTVNPFFIQKIDTLPGTELLPETENIPFAVQFFRSYLLAAHTAEKPDQLFIACLNSRIQKLSQIAGEQQAQQMDQAAQAEQKAKGNDPALQEQSKDKDRQVKMVMQDKDLQTKQVMQQRDLSSKFALQKVEGEQEEDLARMQAVHDQQSEANDKVPDQAGAYSTT